RRAATREIEPNVNVQGLQPKVTNNAKVQAPPYLKFSSTLNPNGFLVPQSHCLTYNQDLNAVMLVQRFTADWPASAFPVAPGAGKSGYTVCKWTVNNGAAWDSTCFKQDDANYGRYPSGVVVNTAGNTNPKLARIVACGPSNTGTNWTGNYFASGLLDGTLSTVAGGHAQTTNDQQFMSATAVGQGYNLSFPRISAVYNSGTVWVGGMKDHTPLTPTGSYGVAYMKGVLNGGGTAMVWTQDSMIGKWTHGSTAALNQGIGTPYIAFGPDKLTGYKMVTGSDTLVGCSPCKGFKPSIWKTTDGGVTWTQKNIGFNWSTLSAAWANLQPTRDKSSTTANFLDNFGGAVAVDANGKLHYITAVSSAYSTHRDSMGYTFTYDYAYTNTCSKPWVIDFSTDGSGAWTAQFIATLNTSNMGATVGTSDTTAAANPWLGTSPNKVSYDNRIQVTSNKAGDKLFYSWSDSDTASNNRYNTSPSLVYMGYDVTGNKYTALKKIDFANTVDGIWFHYVADYAMNPSTGNWQIPAMYISSRGGTFNGTGIVETFYIDDATINNAEFTLTAKAFPVCPAAGINEIASNISSVSQNFPNPFGTTSFVKVNLVNGEKITLNVYNTVGQIVASKQVNGNTGENLIEIDAANMVSGMYFYTVQVGASVVTKKMSVQK
ncbi:MAG TPA: T9SS type A sorting domain-containing protein, partial [Nitrosopumilaceae archaeon]|nr:T9SS type A sorting domain-containing protein [Nitrosopumilaceae archaeon]